VRTDQRVKIASFRSDLAEMINEVRFNARNVVVTKHGEPVAVLISVEELNRLRGMYTSIPQLLPRK
jgi:prevent-host-death family protein